VIVEEWRPITFTPGLEAFYEVSSLGRIRSKDRESLCRSRRGSYKSRRKGKVLCPAANSRGYFTINAYVNGTSASYSVHQLVAHEFLGKKPQGMEVCHGPNGKLDNSVGNLSYGTARQNQGPDKVRDGTSNNGERNPNVKLTKEQAAAIWCERCKPDKARATEIAERFSVSLWTVLDIWNGKTWRCLHTEPGMIFSAVQNHTTGVKAL
jgi:hypothetical protein